MHLRTYVRTLGSVGFNNPDVPWSEIERTLSGRRPGSDPRRWWAHGGTRRETRPGDPDRPEGANGGDSPAWSWHRPDLRPARRGSTATPAPPPTPSCTATRTSASSTGPATPRSWPRRPPASASRRWPSPTTTGSTASSASPRRPGRWGCRPCSGPSCRSASPGPQNGEADPEGHHLLVLARDPEGYARLAVDHQHRAPGRGREGQARLHGRRLGRRSTAATGWCSPGAARGRCPRR